jgi:hypothetical protein
MLGARLQRQVKSVGVADGEGAIHRQGR